ncbi:MAG: helix-turn-helix transcriptional regulator [Alphaproteobacteria bacterium]|nr:helix-turn-helix transcriptional regulator [Rhodospirillales bacterium]MCW9046173.1 helix-turn-helix transcriptional regulator [Alphaproteobacteria bacterium]
MKNRRSFEVKSLVVSFVVIAICEVFFLMDVAADFFYIDIAIAWIDHSAIELVSTFTLAFALFAIGYQIKCLLKEHREAQASVQVAKGELLAVIYAKFDEWHLSPSEREIALLLMKGLTIQEIADVRSTQQGTVKSQSSAIYQKAEVKSRNELVAYFVEDLLGDNFR